MKNRITKRWLIIASPSGYLSARRADYFRRFPDSHQAKWQRVMTVRLPVGVPFETVRDDVYGWAVATYGL